MSMTAGPTLGFEPCASRLAAFSASKASPAPLKAAFTKRYVLYACRFRVGVCSEVSVRISYGCTVPLAPILLMASKKPNNELSNPMLASRTTGWKSFSASKATVGKFSQAYVLANGIQSSAHAPIKPTTVEVALI